MSDRGERLAAPVRRRVEAAGTCLLLDPRGGERAVGAARAHVVLGGCLYLVTARPFGFPRSGGRRVRLALGGSTAAGTEVILSGRLELVPDGGTARLVHRAAARRHPLVRGLQLSGEELAACLPETGDVWRFVPNAMPVTLSA